VRLQPASTRNTRFSGFGEGVFSPERMGPPAKLMLSQKSQVLKCAQPIQGHEWYFSPSVAQ